MASYHFTMKTSKNSEAPAQAHVDYICREGKYSRGTKAEELVYKEHGNLPEWANDNPREFWKNADLYEGTKGGTSYREMELALPTELTEEEQIILVKGFVAEQLGNDFVYSFAIHNKEAALNKNYEYIESDQDDRNKTENPHVHIMFCERKLDGIERNAETFFKRADKKVPERGGAVKDRKWNGKQRSAHLKLLREDWANHQNKSLESSGHSERVDHRSLKAQRQSALERGDIKAAELLDRQPERHIGNKIVELTIYQARKYIREGNTPEERKQRQDEFYKSINKFDNVKNSYLAREIKKANENITKLEIEMAAIKAERPNNVISFEDFKNNINKHSDDLNKKIMSIQFTYTEALKKVIPENKAISIAEHRYFNTLHPEYTKFEQEIKSERIKYDQAIKQHQGIDTKNFSHAQNIQVQENGQKLKEWHSDITKNWNTYYTDRRKKTDNEKKEFTPESLIKINQIKEGILAKNKPMRISAEALKTELNELEFKQQGLEQLRNHMTLVSASEGKTIAIDSDLAIIENVLNQREIINKQLLEFDPRDINNETTQINFADIANILIKRLKGAQKEINQHIGLLRKLSPKITNKNRANKIATYIYTKGQSERLPRKEILLVNQVEKYNLAKKHHNEDKPSLLNFTARARHTENETKIQEWGIALKDNWKAHHDEVQALKRDILQPTSKEAITKLSQGILDKRKIHTETYQKINQRLGLLNKECHDIENLLKVKSTPETKIKIKGNVNDHENIMRQATKIEHTIKEAIQKLSRTNDNQSGNSGIKSKILRDKDEYERD